MTTPSTPRKAGPLLGTGAQTTWPFTFKVFAATDIAVTLADSLGVETALVYGVDYNVTLNANQETSPGGTVTYPISGAALPVGKRLVIFGNLPYDQPLDLPSGGNFSPLALENQLDRLTMQIQQLREQVGRAVQVSVTTSADVGLPAPSANELIGWDSTGQNLQNFALSELAAAVAYATMRYDTFTGDGTETEFTLTADPVTLANLDVAISGVTQTPGSDYSLVSGALVFASAPPNGAEILARYGEGLVNVGGDSSDIRYLPAGTGAQERTVQDKLRESVSVLDFGAVGNGVTDDRAAIQAAVNAHPNVEFPVGYTFLVQNATDRVYLNSNNRLFGGGTVKRADDEWSIFEAIGTINAHIQNITIDGLVFEGGGFTGNSDKGAAGLRCTFADNVTVTNCRANNIGLVSIGVFAERSSPNSGSMLSIGADGAGGIYDSLNLTNLSKNIIVTNNIITNDTYIAQNYWTMIFVGVREWNVSNNVWNGPNAGPLFVGGINGNGTYIYDQAKLKCYNGVFSDNVVRGRRPGFMLWNCHNVVVADNSFYGHDTEPLDVEACSDILVTGNKIRGSQFGLAIYYDCHNLHYENNDVVMDITSGSTAQSLCTVAVGTNFGRLVVKNNRFNTVGFGASPSNKVAGIVLYGGKGELIFEGNDVQQTVLIDVGNGYEYLSISNNRFTIDGGYTTMYNGFARPIIDQVIVISKAPVTGLGVFDFVGNRFIAKGNTVGYNCLRTASSSVQCIYNIKDNFVDNFNALVDFNPPTMAAIIASGVLHDVVITDNQMLTLSYPVTIQGTTTATQARFVWKNNCNGAGFDSIGAIPTALPYPATFSVTSTVMNNTPTIGQPMGWVCTAQGNPGTWRPLANVA